jgi:hypothetical protein
MLDGWMDPHAAHVLLGKYIFAHGMTLWGISGFFSMDDVIKLYSLVCSISYSNAHGRFRIAL